MKNNIGYNELLEIMNERHSCRHYTTEAVSREDIEKILEAARIAPSACNKQPWRFVVVTSADKREKVCQSYDRTWVRNAQAFIVALGQPTEAWHREKDGFDATPVDLAIAVEHICLAATSLGLGSCWVCNFDKETLMNGLGISAEWEPIAIVPLGHQDMEKATNKTPRKAIDEITEWM